MSNELLIVYNTCGINGNDRTRLDKYIESIESILNQEFEHSINLCISSCLNSDSVIGTLQDHFFDSADICRVQEVVPVNVSFNKSVQECVKRYGNFAGYIYIDSGIILRDSKTISNLWDTFCDYEYEMIAATPTSDSGFEDWQIKLDKEKDHNIIPLGRAVNLHCQLFGHNIFSSFNNRIISDIFASFCTESTFTFICAALQSKFAILPNTIVDHLKELDGPSSGFPARHDEVFRLNKSMADIIYSQESIESGYGYEEFRGLLMHNPAMFDNDGYAIGNKLFNFIANNLYLPQHILNYDKLKGEFWQKV